jgi:hypothetical protein
VLAGGVLVAVGAGRLAGAPDDGGGGVAAVAGGVSVEPEVQPASRAASSTSAAAPVRAMDRG